MANASFGLGESPFIFASVCKCEGVQRIFGSITKGAPALHKLYTRERVFCFGIENYRGNRLHIISYISTNAARAYNNDYAIP